MAPAAGPGRAVLGCAVPKCYRQCHNERFQAVPYRMCQVIPHQLVTGCAIPNCQAIPYHTVPHHAILNCSRLSHTKLFQAIPYQTLLGCAKLCQAGSGGSG